MGFVRQEDVVIFPFEELEKVVFISAEPTKRQWLGSEIIVTTQGMIDTLQSEKYWNEHFVAANEEVFQDGFLLINYSDRINTEELERLSELKKHLMDYRLFWEKYEKQLGVWPQCSMSDDDTRLGMELMEKQIQELREWFRKRGVLLVEMYFTC